MVRPSQEFESPRLHHAHSQGLLRPEFFNNGVRMSPALSGEAGALNITQAHDRPQDHQCSKNYVPSGFARAHIFDPTD